MKGIILFACACLSIAAQEPDLAADLISNGYAALEAGDSIGAAARFEDAVAVDPSKTVAWKQLGYLYLERGDRESAADAFEAVAGRTPEDWQARLQLAHVYRRLGRWDEARRAFEEIAVQAPPPWAAKGASESERAIKPARAALDLAYGELADGDFEAAIGALREAVRVDPGDTAALKELAYALLRAGETEQARDAFQQALELAPADERTALELAYLEHETGRAAEALKRFSALRESSDESMRAAAAETAARIEAELDASIARWEATIVADPANRSVQIELGDLYRDRNEPEQAATRYLAAWNLDGPNRDEILLKLAAAREAAGDPIGAQGAWLAASRSPEVRIAEIARDSLPDRHTWANEYRAALELRPADHALRKELAYLLLEVGLHTEAMAEFEILVREAPADLQAVAQLAFLYRSRGNSHAAAELLERVERALPGEDAARTRLDSGESPSRRAAHLSALGEKSLEKSYLLDARRQFTEAYEADPDNHVAALKLGVVHNLLEQDRKAIEWFRIAGESEDPRIADQARRSYRNLAPQFQRMTTTVWAYPVYSRRFGTVFGYAQAKTEFRLGRSPLKPYVSMRLSGDVKRTTGGTTPRLLSENAVIAAGGLRLPLDGGVTLWGEAGQSMTYLSRPPTGTARSAPDYRGGLNWFRARGAALGGDEPGIFYEANLDAVYVSRFNDDVLAYAQFRPGYRLPTRGPLRAQVYVNWNVTMDRGGEYWANYAEVGPGIRFRIPKIHPPMNFSLDWVRGVHLSNRGNIRGPNYFDLRAAIWYSFTR